MAKVSKHFGLTLPGTVEFSSFRVDVTFADIDTEGSVEEQLKACAEAASKIDTYVEEALVEQAKTISGVTISGFGLASAVEKLTKVQEKIIAEVKRHKEILAPKSNESN